MPSQFMLGFEVRYPGDVSLLNFDHVVFDGSHSCNHKSSDVRTRHTTPTQVVFHLGGILISVGNSCPDSSCSPPSGVDSFFSKLFPQRNSVPHLPYCSFLRKALQAAGYKWLCLLPILTFLLPFHDFTSSAFCTPKSCL